MQILSHDKVRDWFGDALPDEDFAGKRVLLIVPDRTRTAPLPLLFDGVYSQLRPLVETLDVMVALGTHPPMSESQLCRLLGIREEERQRLFFQTQLLNHEWDNPEALVTIGQLSREQIESVSGGLLSEEVPVRINAAIENYDLLLVLGPVFPHEVVGFSGDRGDSCPAVC